MTPRPIFISAWLMFFCLFGLTNILFGVNWTAILLLSFVCAWFALVVVRKYL
jgi:hypothetical protein